MVYSWMSATPVRLHDARSSVTLERLGFVAPITSRTDILLAQDFSFYVDIC